MIHCSRCLKEFENDVAFQVSPCKIEKGEDSHMVTNTMMDAYLCFECLTNCF
jgi:hypothetical protein